MGNLAIMLDKQVQIMDKQGHNKDLIAQANILREIKYEIDLKLMKILSNRNALLDFYFEYLF